MVAFKASDLLPSSNKSSGGKGGGGGGDGGGSENISEDWTRFGKKQILSIGKKRQRLHEENDIEDDDAVGGDGYNSSSDEEEGRTSAVREKKRKLHRPSHVVAAPTIQAEASADVEEPASSKKKKKKKKGKKERDKENTAKDEELSMKEDTTTDVPKESKTADNLEVKTANSNSDSKSETPNPSNKVNSKRKRKKVRSRQKNIRKDNRATDDKPSHLILGRADYAGRPMTEATRKKLGIESASAVKNTNKSSLAANDAFDSGEWVGGDKTTKNANTVEDTGESVSKQTKPKVKEETALTKIGDCIVGSDMIKPDGGANKQHVGEKSLSETKDKKKKSKKAKKRKFKNLAV